MTELIDIDLEFIFDCKAEATYNVILLWSD
jgi:hypothetical protein